ncbi:NAD-dependent epimerase/dehydratase family protein [Streptomonospora algeriensis]|uniref:NAD-dependent epimerase/dehydratase family protein n=1 Tax=Streptomonospora algeriensis TaxID=995084 RepID=A0ABW3BBU4_9ACTN
MRIFLIGATGVLGRALVPQLLESGHQLAVMAPDRLDTLPRGVTRVKADLLDPALELAELLSGYDAVVNLATSMPRDPAARGAWAENTRIRSQGTSVLTRALREAGIGRFVQMSITMAYADGGDTWLDESAPFDADPGREAVVLPVADLEAAVMELPAREVAWTLLRGARFAGPDTMQDLQRRQLARGALAIPGDGRTFVSMVHVADFADAVVAALLRGPAGRVFNIADEPMRVGDYFTALAKTADCPPPGRDPHAVSEPSHRVDSTAARADLGWKPRRGVLPVR